MPIHYLGFFDWKIMNNKSKIYSISDTEFIKLVQNSTCYSDVLRAFGLSTSGESSRKVLKCRIAELSCSTEHFVRYKLPSKEIITKHQLSDVLVENSVYQNRTSLKKRLINEGILEYCCAICKLSDWQGKHLSLQLDHINGVNNDNRINNLRLLCPNCHSQTTTYAGKNSK
jgi:5-methylcytosine-specific restriction endonuclease McrA